MDIFLDESGDLGWTFDKPNNNGGSSRYITIAGIVIDPNEMKHLNRYIADIYRKYNLTPKIEKKGPNIDETDSSYILNNLNTVVKKAPSFRIIAITARKENVYEQLRKDRNIFYNYMLGVLLPDVLKKYESVNITIDKRTIKVESGRSFQDYIRVKCWGELNIKTAIECRYDSSDKNEGIWMADWMASFVWRHFENQNSNCFEIFNSSLKSIFHCRTLFINNRAGS